MSKNPPFQNSAKHNSETWDALAAKAQQGDKRAYAQLLHEIDPFIKKVTVGTLANVDWVDDLAQEILLSIHKALHSYDPKRPFKQWMMAIVHFRRTDFLRKYYNQRGNMQSSLDENPLLEKNFVTDIEHAGEYKDIEQALDMLKPEQREVFVKIKIEGYSTKEVAREMDMSESAVKVSAHRSLKKMKEYLGRD